MTVCSLLTSSILSVNFPIVSGGFALLATTGTALAGLGGGAGGAAGSAGAVGAVLGPGGVVTGLTPIVGTLGLLGEDVIYEEQSQYSMSHLVKMIHITYQIYDP